MTSRTATDPSSALLVEIADRSKEIHTDGYPMSIGEMISLYRDGDIDIHPEFQRIFIWSQKQKSSLIESILLKIPIPPIFVSQRQDGVWDVIDGVQRLSTILEFVGAYRDENGTLTEPSTLLKTDYLPSLDGFRWDTGQLRFSEALQRDLKRAKIEFRIIRKESDDNAKYDLFQRLNSGAQLSQQEVRNCLLVMLNKKMFEQLNTLATFPAFLESVPLSDAKEERAYRQELVLRFFMQEAYSGSDRALPEEFGDFLTSWMRTSAKSTHAALDENLFERTFATINTALGEDAFRRYDPATSRHLGPFSIACYEFVTTGVAANIDYWMHKIDELRNRVQAVWAAAEFRGDSGTGVSPRRRVPKLIVSRIFFAPPK
jgi:hypothetical protein